MNILSGSGFTKVGGCTVRREDGAITIEGPDGQEYSLEAFEATTADEVGITMSQAKRIMQEVDRWLVED